MDLRAGNLHFSLLFKSGDSHPPAASWDVPLRLSPEMPGLTDTILQRNSKREPLNTAFSWDVILWVFSHRNSTNTFIISSAVASTKKKIQFKAYKWRKTKIKLLHTVSKLPFFLQPHLPLCMATYYISLRFWSQPPMWMAASSNYMVLLNSKEEDWKKQR